MMQLAKKGVCAFPEYIQDKRTRPFWANQTSGQCKSTLQRGITSHHSEGSSSQTVKTRNAGKGVEKREPCYADGGNVNCQGYTGEVYCVSLKI